MCVKTNYYRDLIPPKIFLFIVVGVGILLSGENKVCSGSEINKLEKNSIFYQKLSSGKAINYYKNIENGEFLEPLTYDLLVLQKPYIKPMEKYNWSLASKNHHRASNRNSSLIKIPLDVPKKNIKKAFKNIQNLYLDYTEEYTDSRNLKHKDVRRSIAMLQIFIENKNLKRKWVICVPYLYIVGRIELPKKWSPISIWYLLSRELGMRPNNIGRYSVSEKNIFFKIRLHERLSDFDAMRITVDKKQFKNHFISLGKRDFLLRLGHKDDFNYIGKVIEGAILTNYQNNLIATSHISNDYSEFKIDANSDVYLEELTFNFPLLDLPLKPDSFVKEISFYKSSQKKIITKINNDFFKPIFVAPQFIRSMGKGVGRLTVDLSSFSDALRKVFFMDMTKILKAELIVDTRESRVNKVTIFKKGTLEFRQSPEVVIFKNKKKLNKQDLLEKIPVPIDHIKILNVHIDKKIIPLLGEFFHNLLSGNSFVVKTLFYIFCLVVVFICYCAIKNYKTIMASIVYHGKVLVTGFQLKSNYFLYLGIFFCSLGIWVSFFGGFGAFDQVYDVNFFTKDIFYTFGGIVLALNWKYQCVKIHKWLKYNQFNLLRDFFKSYNYSYLTGITVVLILCAIVRKLYLPLVEVFSSISISFMIVGAYHYFYQKTEYEVEISTTNN